MELCGVAETAAAALGLPELFEEGAAAFSFRDVRNLGEFVS